MRGAVTAGGDGGSNAGGRRGWVRGRWAARGKGVAETGGGWGEGKNKKEEAGENGGTTHNNTYIYIYNMK